MSEVTRFYDREIDGDGPVSGALQIITIGFDDVANDETVSRRIDLPVGCSFYVTDAYLTADGVTSDPSLTIGTTAAGTQLVKAVNIATDTGSLSLKQNQVTAGSVIDVVVVADSGDAAESVSITIVGHITAPPTSVAYRT